MKTSVLGRLLFFFVSLLLSMVSFGQITVGSLQELKPFLDDDNVNIKLSPGDYYLTGQDCEDGLFGDDLAIDSPEKVMFLFSGNTIFR